MTTNQIFKITILQPHESVLLLINIIHESHFESQKAFNEIAHAYNVQLVTYDEFIQYLKQRGDNPNTFPPKMSRFAYTDAINNKIFIIYNPWSNGAGKINGMLRYEFTKMLRHEGVHRSQVNKYVEHDLKEIDVRDEKSYLSHPREIMAMARTIVDELMDQPKELAEFKRTKKIRQTYQGSICNTLDFYKKNFNPDDPVYKRLMKYIYQYLESEKN